MKKIIYSFILLFLCSISYAGFDYSKGFVYSNCKIKVLYESSFKNFEKEINDFCNGKNIIEIKCMATSGTARVIIIYK